jgi:hypothetical protein
MKDLGGFLGSLFVAALALAVGIGLLLLLRSLKFNDTTTFIALLFLPILVWGVASGKISEITGPGGWSAKFKEAAREAAGESPDIEMENFQIVEKEAASALPKKIAAVPAGKPVAMSLQLGKAGYYGASAIARYIDRLSKIDPDLLVVVVDDDGRFVAAIPAARLLSSSRVGGVAAVENGDAFVDAIGNSNQNYLRNLPAANFRSIPEKTSNAVALSEMRKANAKSLVVVDDDKRPIGIVKRDRIVAHLVETLASASG